MTHPVSDIAPSGTSVDVPGEGCSMGFLADGTFRMPVRVYYEDTDAGGIVYHSIYLNYAERCRSEFIRALGINQQALRDAEGLGFAVTSCNVTYRRPAKLDDMLSVEARMVSLGGASLVFEQVVKRGDETLVTLDVKVACISAQGRAVRIPATMRQALLKTLRTLSDAAGASAQ